MQLLKTHNLWISQTTDEQTLILFIDNDFGLKLSTREAGNGKLLSKSTQNETGGRLVTTAVVLLIFSKLQSRYLYPVSLN
jgi:hypothetical protein